MYIDLLGGDELVHLHKPTFSRKWFRQEIIRHTTDIQYLAHRDKNKPGCFFIHAKKLSIIKV